MSEKTQNKLIDMWLAMWTNKKSQTPKGEKKDEKVSPVKKYILGSINIIVANFVNSVAMLCLLSIVTGFTGAFGFYMFAPPNIIERTGWWLATISVANGWTDFSMVYASFVLANIYILSIVVILFGALRRYDIDDDKEFDALLKERVTLNEMVEWSGELTQTERDVLVATLIQFAALEDGANGAELLNAVKAS